MAWTPAHMAHPEDTPVEELLRHASWIRGLARSLTADVHRAEDLTQDTWLAALQHRPGREGNLRGWLGRVMGNAWRQERRGEGRRRAREQSVQRSGRVDEPADAALERLSVHQELVAAVAELEEPFRKTILLRYFDGLSLAEIAQRTGVPVSTVGSRVSRGIARLRAALERRSGERTDWLGAVALLAWGPPAAGPSSTTIGLFSMSIKTNLILAGSAVAGVLGLYLFLDRTPVIAVGGGGPAAELELTALAAADSVATLSSEALAGERQVLAEPALAASSASPPPAPAPASADDGLLHGRVIDLDSRPVAYLDVMLSGSDQVRRQSDAEGRFTAPTPTERVEITPDEEGWAHVFAGVWAPGSSREVVLVVAPAVAARGSVFDEDGEPLSAAYLRFVYPDGLRTRFTEILDSSDAHAHEARVDAGGGFALDPLPRIAGATLLFACEGFEDESLPIEPFEQGRVDVVLRRRELAGATLTGEVIDASGRPVPDAHVALGWISTRTDATGLFRLDATEAGLDDRVLALAPGWQPGVVEEPPAAAAELPWEGHVVVQLGPAPLTITGTVLDADGAPVADARVWPTDATFFGMIEGRGVRAEGLLSGRPVQEDDDPDYSELSTASFPWVRTDARGRFELAGMLDRVYTLRAFDVETLNLVELAGVRGGARHVDLRLDRKAVHERAAGVVLDPGGHALPGVRVTVQRDADWIPWGAHGRVIWRETGTSLVTDVEGRFAFRDLPREGVTLRFEGDSIVPLEHGLETLVEQAPEHDPTRLHVELNLRYHVQVLLEDESWSWVERVQVLDEAGQPMELRVIGATGYSSSDQAEVIGGRSNMLSLAGGAATVRLVGADGREELVPVAFDAQRVFLVENQE